MTLVITGWDVCTILLTGALFRININERFDVTDSAQSLFVTVSQEDGFVTLGYHIVVHAIDDPATGCIDAP